MESVPARPMETSSGEPTVESHPRTASAPAAADLVTQMVHDIRSPVAAVVALTGVLREDLHDVLSGHQRHQLNLIYNAAIQLEYLMSDLIELTQPREALLRRCQTPFSVLGLLEGVRDFLQPLSELRGSEIEIACSAVPDGRIGPASVLSRVLLNLTAPTLRNASRGTVTLGTRAVGGDRLEFVVHSQYAPLDEVVVEAVRDVASGLRPRQPFCYSNLGLEVAFRLVTLLGSSLEVEFPEGGGTRYSVVLDCPPIPPAGEDP